MGKKNVLTEDNGFRRVQVPDPKGKLDLFREEFMALTRRRNEGVDLFPPVGPIRGEGYVKYEQDLRRDFEEDYDEYMRDREASGWLK